MKYYIEPNDSHKSFYRKAYVEMDDEGTKVLTSYDTEVAMVSYDKGKKIAKVRGLYSQTTTRHIKAFLQNEGFDYKDSKDIMKRYG